MLVSQSSQSVPQELLYDNCEEVHVQPVEVARVDARDGHVEVGIGDVSAREAVILEPALGRG